MQDSAHRSGLILAAAAALALFAAPAIAAPRPMPGQTARCDLSAPSADLVVRFCTEEIESGRLTGSALARAHAIRGFAHRHRQNHDAAIDDFSEAMRIEPDPRLTFERGITYMMHWLHEKAIADLEEAIQHDPRFAPVLPELAARLSEEQYFSDALLYIEAALRRTPNDPSLLGMRGGARDYLGQQDAAIADFDAVIRLTPDDPKPYLDRAVSLMHLRKYDLALKDLDHALTLDPGFVQARFTRGRALFDLQRFEDAAAEFRWSVDEGRKDAFSAIWLYLSQTRAGQDGRDELRENARRLDLEKWPGPVIALLADAITPDELMQIARDSDGRVARNQRCEGLFFIGQYHLIGGRTAEAIEAFEATVATGVIEFVEYWHAKAELERLRR